MIIHHKIGHLGDFAVNARSVEWIAMEWHETSKRILNKHTSTGREVVLKFLNGHSGHKQDDVVFEDEFSVILIEVNPCKAIAVKPANFYQTAALCYEIGNKHLPLFYENDMLLIPYDAPLFRWLNASGYYAEIRNVKLLHSLKTSVMAHGHDAKGSSLFSKILQLTTSADEK
jgi:urease accessory protein